MKTTRLNKTAVRHFWSWFIQNQEQMLAASVDPHSFSDYWKKELELHLGAVCKEVAFELWHKPTRNEHWLILTVFGHAPYFPVVDTIIEQAPYAQGWSFYALLPPASPEFRLAEEGDLSRFNPLDLSFSPLDLATPPYDPDTIVLYTENDEYIDDDEEVIWTLLYNLVGERAIGSRFNNLLILPKEATYQNLATMKPITELPAWFPKEEMSGFTIDKGGHIRPDTSDHANDDSD